MTSFVKNMINDNRDSYRFSFCWSPINKENHKEKNKVTDAIVHGQAKALSGSDFKKHVIWKDLLHYKPWETIKELLHPIPWLILALLSSSYLVSQKETSEESLYIAMYLLTILSSFYFFLTGLRVTHNAFHYCLGLSRSTTDGVMFILSWLMLGSLHAVQYTHLQHHRHCLGENDIEGSVAKHGFWEALIKGLLFPWRIHRAALIEAKPKYRRWIYAELSMNVIWLSTIWLWLDSSSSFVMALRIHTGFMIVAYALSAFFAVWTVHHDTYNEQGEYDHWDNSRTMRSTWKSVLFYNMFYHIEHHLFPQIPTCHLPELAKRLDSAGYNSHKKVI